MSNVVIVSRHAATAAWIIEAAGLPADTRVITGNATPSDVDGKVVYGNVPLHLAMLATVVVAVEFDTPPRGAELDAAAMVEAGARLAPYVVRPLGGNRAGDGWCVTYDGRYVVTRPQVAEEPVGFRNEGPAGFRDSNN